MFLSAGCVSHNEPLESLVLGVLLSFCDFGLNTCVRTDFLFRLAKAVSVGANKLSGVVAGTVSNNNLGRVLVGHHDRGTGESVTVRVGVVGLQLLSVHSGVGNLSSLEGFAITVK